MRTIGLSLVDSGNEYQQLLYEDARAVARKAGLLVEAHFCEGDFSKQLEQVGTILEGPPVALVIMAVHDRGLGRAVRRAAREGVHCIFLNEVEDPLDTIRRESPGVAICQLCADEDESGRIQGRLVRGLLRGGGRLLLVEGTRRSLTARGRTAGLLEVLQESSIEVDRLEAGWTVEDGEAAGYRWLRIAVQFNRALDAIVCHNDSLAVGVRRALVRVAVDLGRPEIRQLPIVGCDGTPDLGLAMAREGTLAGTVIQPRLAAAAVECVVEVLGGASLPLPVTRLAGAPFPDDVVSPRPARVARR